jgi:hypothetical protein
MKNYYPVSAGNLWTYKKKDGNTYTNMITSVNGSEFSMTNTDANGVNESNNKIENNFLMSDVYEEGRMQPNLKLDGQVGDTWEVNFKANNFDNVLVYVVKEMLAEKAVEGKNYTDIMVVQAESKMIVNGNLMSINFFTTYYYAAGVGLILTTLALGENVNDEQALVNYQLN